MPASRARMRFEPLHRRRAASRDDIGQRFGGRVRFRDSAEQSWERAVDASSPLSTVGGASPKRASHHVDARRVTERLIYYR